MTKNLGSTELKRLHRQWRRRTDQKVAMILDGVQNPFNVGSIVRTAAAFAVEPLWLVGAVPSPSDAKVQKTALGTQRYLSWSRCDTPADALAAAHDEGMSVVGVELADAAEPLHALDLTGDVCLVLGHEDRGLSAAMLEGCDAIGYIPQIGKVGSLNVATAAALALYEVRRQSWAPPSPR